ncbi:MAG: hypothetical protein U1C55_03295 [Smithellaceae bacterium]|nr:hypothetical protein [Smithellaceae bacterium]
MKIYTLDEVVRKARQQSPFYREKYLDLPAAGWALEDLPVIDQAEFWRANSFCNNHLLTGPLEDGLVFKSGGTTGDPKFSVFTKEEWQTFTELFGRGLLAGGLKDNERVANIFYAGDLYASFLFITCSLLNCPTGVLQFPIVGSTPVGEIVKLIREYQIDVLAGVPTSILAIGEYLEGDTDKSLPVRKILFGGETMYQDQREYLARLIPGVRIASIGYASVDAGLLGYADEGCAPNEHRGFEDATILEIIDEDTLCPIREADRPGRLIVTNLTRQLMPIIRYPVGDNAEWVEAEGVGNRKFMILGRSEESARIGPMTMYVKDIREILHTFKDKARIINFQMCVNHQDKKDTLVLRLASPTSKDVLHGLTTDIVGEIARARPMYQELVSDNKINPIVIDWIQERELFVNKRTGKLMMVIDKRFE